MDTQALPVFHIIFGGPIGAFFGLLLSFLGGLCAGFGAGRWHAKWGGSI